MTFNDSTDLKHGLQTCDLHGGKIVSFIVITPHTKTTIWRALDCCSFFLFLALNVDQEWCSIFGQHRHKGLAKLGKFINSLRFHSMKPRINWKIEILVLKRGRSGVYALWWVTELSRRRRKVSIWLHEDDGIDTRGELPINALPQRTNEAKTNNLRATRPIP